jgi:fatty-acyl-CoA synthase
MSSPTISSSRQLLVGEALNRALHREPNKDAFVFENDRITYQELVHRVKHLSGWIQNQGIDYQDKVGFILKNGIPFVEIFFAVTLSGGVGVPINFRLSASEIEYIVNNSDAKVLFIDKEFKTLIHSIRENIPQVHTIVVVGDTELTENMINYDAIYKTQASFKPIVKLTDEDACMIVYTSGTTGRPKGAVLTHKNLYINSMNSVIEFGHDHNFKQLIVPPMFHVAAMSTLVTNCFIVGTTVIHREFVPENILKTIEKERISTLFLVPAMWNFLLQVPDVDRYDLSSVTKCATGAAICPLELKKTIMKYFPNAGIYDVFGQTEMSPSATSLKPADSLRKTTSVGKPVVNVLVRVVDENMNDVPIGEVGEIVYQGPTVMKEYYKNPEATNEAFRGGWFHSGDLVRMDEEGFIYVVDRKKDMIISGGENIYPAEIEEVLYAHPDILEAAVVGLPDPNWGEKVKAFVVTKPERNVTEKEIIEYCASRIASYKKPKMVEFIEALPRNAAGKVLKIELRKQVSGS